MDLCPRLSSHPLILPPLSNRDFLTPNRQHCGSDPPAECRGSMLSGTRRWNTGRLGMLGNPSEVREVRQLGGFNPKKRYKQGLDSVGSSNPAVCGQQHATSRIWALQTKVSLWAPTGRVTRHKMSAAKKPTITDNCRAMVVQAQKWQVDAGLCLNIRQTRERRLHMQFCFHHIASKCCNNQVIPHANTTW